MPDPDDLLLPEGSVLVHIGPYKTGSSAIQSALHRSRAALLEHGVLYPGKEQRHRRPGWAVLNRTPRGRPHAGIGEWYALVEEIAGSPAPRACISTEDLGAAGPKQARRVVTDLGPDRVHVVAVVRRLDHLLPSQWQERVKTCHETKTYDQWLRAVLGEDRTEPSARAFWASHDVIGMAEKWVAAAGEDRVTLIVSDDSDRRLLPGTFERMLGLPRHFLVPVPGSNSSLTAERVELIRRVTEAFEAHDWSDTDYWFMVQRGLLGTLREAGPSPYDVPIPPLPPWAAQRVTEIGDERVTALKELGVRLVGDPECLRSQAPAAGDEVPEPPDAISLSVATVAIEGAVRGALTEAEEVRRRSERELRALQRDLRALESRLGRSVDETSGRDLLRIVARRAAAKARSRVRRHDGEHG